MNEFVPDKNPSSICVNDSVMGDVSQLDSKTLLILGGMACIAVVACVACVSFSGGELYLSKDGFCIKQSRTTAA